MTNGIAAALRLYAILLLSVQYMLTGRSLFISSDKPYQPHHAKSMQCARSLSCASRESHQRHHLPDAFQQAVHVEFQVAADGYTVGSPTNLINLLHAAHVNLHRSTHSTAIEPAGWGSSARLALVTAVLLAVPKAAQQRRLHRRHQQGIPHSRMSGVFLVVQCLVGIVLLPCNDCWCRASALSVQTGCYSRAIPCLKVPVEHAAHAQVSHARLSSTVCKYQPLAVLWVCVPSSSMTHLVVDVEALDIPPVALNHVNQVVNTAVLLEQQLSTCTRHSTTAGATTGTRTACSHSQHATPHTWQRSQVAMFHCYMATTPKQACLPVCLRLLRMSSSVKCTPYRTRPKHPQHSLPDPP